MTDIIIMVVLALIVGGAITYIIKAKKSGQKCIGCPFGNNCPSENGKFACTCGYQTDAKD